MINMIVACDKAMGIGKDNKIPWKLPNDMKFFKRTTMGKVVVMGRKTHESIGRLLPDRCNVIITRDTSYKVDGAFIINSIEKLIEFCNCMTDVFIIGGAEIYTQMLPYVDRLYLTTIDKEYDCDARLHLPIFPFNKVNVLETHNENGVIYTISEFTK